MNLKGNLKFILSMVVLIVFACSLAVPVAPAEEEEKREIGAQPLGNLDIGDRVVDNSWKWEHRTGLNYTAYEGDVVKPVTWIVVAGDHYGEGGVTLLSEELIGMHAFDDSTHEHEDGFNHWGESGTHDSAERGLRPWLNSDGIHAGEGFFEAFSDTFKRGVIPTSVPNKEWGGSSYRTEDKVFVPSGTELGDTEHDHTHEIGAAYPYFEEAEDGVRIAELPRLGTRWYWTRSPYAGGPNYVSNINREGAFDYYSGAGSANHGVRAAVNMQAEIPVSGEPDEFGIYEMEYDYEPGIDVNRIYGSQRYETAVEISEEAFPHQADAVVLARGDDFPDVLAGVPLAYEKGGPILLSLAEQIPHAVTHEMERLLSEGDNVYILGGTAAISSEVEEKLEREYEVERLAGENRYATAVEIAEELTADPAEVFLTSGMGFADALSASGPAAVRNAPILLTDPDELSAHTEYYLEEHAESITRINVIGGEYTVSGSVKEDAGGTERIFGQNRWETAVEIAREFFSEPQKATLATGFSYPDALSGGVYAALHESPVLLTARENLPEETTAYFRQEETLANVTIFGGEEAVSKSVVRGIEFIR